MKDSSNKEKCTAMEEEYLIGVAIMKVSGRIICGTDKVNSSTSRAMFLKDNGQIMYHMDNYQ